MEQSGRIIRARKMESKGSGLTEAVPNFLQGLSQNILGDEFRRDFPLTLAVSLRVLGFYSRNGFVWLELNPDTPEIL